MTLGTGTGYVNKISAVLLASVLLFSTVSIASLAGMTPLPTAYAGGEGSSIVGFICDVTPISSDNEGSDSAMTFRASEGVFLWASFDALFRLTVDGDKTFIGFMDHDTKGLAFSLDGSTLFSIESKNDELQLHIVNPADASAVDSITITLAGETVNGGTGLATHPTTGELWALLKIGKGGRELVTIDPDTGVATSIGNTGLNLAGIAFNSSGTLFAISGSGASISNSIFTVNTSNATPTFVCSNGEGFSGGSIAFNPNDQTLYLSINDAQFFKFNGGLLNQCETQKIPTNVDRTITAMTFFESAGVFLFASFRDLWDLTLDGDGSFIQRIGFPSFGHNSKGLAFSLDGSTLFSIDRSGNQLHIVDPADASIDDTKTITLTGETVRGGHGLATHPTTGELWAIIRTGFDRGDRDLVTIDPDTGAATIIGKSGHISGIAFDSSGTLFGVTGDGAIPSETLVTLSQTDGSASIVCALGAGDRGEALAFNPDDAALYHMSGSVFEKIIGFDAGTFAINAKRLALFSLDNNAPLLHELDLPSADVIRTIFIKSEFEIVGGNALVTSPSNTMFAVFFSSGDREGEKSGERRLATINPTTGQTKDIGPLGNSINAIAFKDGTLFGVSSRNNPGPVGDNAFVSINTNTAEVTFICQLPTGSRPNIGFNPENNSLYYARSSQIDRIVDIEDCELEGEGGGGGFEFILGIVTLGLFPDFLPEAYASHTTGFRALTWWVEEGLFLVGSRDTIRTHDLDTGDSEILNNDIGHDTKGLAFATVGGGGGGGGDHEPPTIGTSMNGNLIVTCGVAFDSKCFTITAPFHEEFKLYEMMSGTHTISITMYCSSGVNTCNYVAIGIMPYSESMDNTTWTIELYKDFEGNLTPVITDPEGYLGTVTVTTQILDDQFWLVSFTVNFKNKDTGPMMFGIQARDSYNGVRNWYLNEGVEFIDSDAYPSIETEYKSLLEIDSLCLNEDPTYRYSCAFAKIRERAIQIAEETLRQIMNN